MSKRLFQHTKHQEHCPQCEAILQIKQGKKGLFLGCSNYPACDYIKPLHPHNESKVLKNLVQNCPECGHILQLKQGSYGMFIGCSNYPECRFIVHEEQETIEQPIVCPECQLGELVARRGRQGKTFYGCNQYPKCKFTLAQKPHLITCPQCQTQGAILKKEEENHHTWLCINKSCQHSFKTTI
ncbi:DNA topoisomerase I-like protein [Canicola haemoglobinophilus]|uniref:DNA topoisomerase I-like protein n=1 Tax=Canicola haemoglobinophilus TaxID=733 RepID=A0AB38H9Z4_9PAST|nr:type I DNA topoisomerase [Canicola haemoglobinophilus]STO55261.1 DNA topoisomerase I-like protein [Canicola haemoglobinophilus]STO69169.1 DNA topoisomerase I-like protein [Canicola haemoglobinophilus]